MFHHRHRLGRDLYRLRGALIAVVDQVVPVVKLLRRTRVLLRIYNEIVGSQDIGEDLVLQVHRIDIITEGRYGDVRPIGMGIWHHEFPLLLIPLHAG